MSLLARFFNCARVIYFRHCNLDLILYFVLYLATFLIGSAVLSIQGLDLETTMSTTASLMSTTGIAFGKIGASGSFELFSPGMKLFISLFMMVGRLEMFTVFVILTPGFWNPNNAKIKY